MGVKIKVKIEEITTVDNAFSEGVARLVPQLSQRASAPSSERLERIAANPSSHMLAAVAEDGTIAGITTLIITEIPTSCKAWTEDVVVDEKYRGQGIGRALVTRAVEMARECGAEQIMLTSNPSRTVARKLYAECGFSEVETTLFRLFL